MFKTVKHTLKLKTDTVYNTTIQFQSTASYWTQYTFLGGATISQSLNNSFVTLQGLVCGWPAFHIKLSTVTNENET